VLLFGSWDYIGDAGSFVVSGKFLAHGLLNLGAFWLFWLPFPAIFLVIIEFFGAVGVSDVAVAFGSKAVVIVAKTVREVLTHEALGFFIRTVRSFPSSCRSGGLQPVRAARAG
ncbi:MAG: hypothetical protein L7V86_04680, partial [Verrucomicrobiales bacterium]|nr:hypothetical protein [Verrucomicrobiales bacterium]